MATRENGAQRESSLRLRRAVEIIYQVDGVTGARLWQWSGRIAVGLNLSAASSPAEVIARVMSAVAPLREASEIWDFGVLTDP
jgi:hypothetical protein